MTHSSARGHIDAPKSILYSGCVQMLLSVWGQLNFMLGSETKACKPLQNDLKSDQRHRHDLSV